MIYGGHYSDTRDADTTQYIVHVVIMSLLVPIRCVIRLSIVPAAGIECDCRRSGGRVGVRKDDGSNGPADCAPRAGQSQTCGNACDVCDGCSWLALPSILCDVCHGCSWLCASLHLGLLICPRAWPMAMFVLTGPASDMGREGAPL